MQRIDYKFFLQSQTHTVTAKMKAIQKGRTRSALNACLKIQSFTEPLLFHWIFKEKAKTDNKLTKSTKSSKQMLPC